MNRKRNRRRVDGLLLLDKPTGLTANAALQRVRHLYQAAKAGHTGSLDPLASGMLPICFGEATKVAGYLLGADKCYEVEACFGARTDTGDADGRIVEQASAGGLHEAGLREVLEGFRGDILQVPPMYSALKKDGRRLYELARAGIEVEREPRPVHIAELELLHFEPGRASFRVRCSKGTYVRTLVEDIARAAGTLGYVTALRRPTVEPFREEQMLTLPGLEAQFEAGGLAALDRLLLPVEEGLQGWPAVNLGPSESFYLRQGNPVTLGGQRPETGMVRIYGPGTEFLGIGELLPEGMVAPRRLMVRQSPGGMAAGCR